MSAMRGKLPLESRLVRSHGELRSLTGLWFLSGNRLAIQYFAEDC